MHRQPQGDRRVVQTTIGEDGYEVEEGGTTLPGDDVILRVPLPLRLGAIAAALGIASYQSVQDVGMHVWIGIAQIRALGVYFGWLSWLLSVLAFMLVALLAIRAVGRAMLAGDHAQGRTHGEPDEAPRVRFETGGRANHYADVIVWIVIAGLFGLGALVLARDWNRAGEHRVVDAGAHEYSFEAIPRGAWMTLEGYTRTDDRLVVAALTRSSSRRKAVYVAVGPTFGSVNTRDPIRWVVLRRMSTDASKRVIGEIRDEGMSRGRVPAAIAHVLRARGVDLADDARLMVAGRTPRGIRVTTVVMGVASVLSVFAALVTLLRRRTAPG